jgi:hypothetical protein
MQGRSKAVGSLPSTDFFLVSLPKAGRLIAGVHAQGEYTRLSLLGPDGQLLIQSDGQSPANPDDLIDQHLDGGTTYYLEVQGPSNGPGSYDLMAEYAATSVPFQPIPGRQPQAVVTGDFNGDGGLDMAVTDTGPFRGAPYDIRVLLGQGDGTFQTETIPLGQFPIALVTGDFNGDGRTDLAVAGEGSFGNGYVTVLLGQGDGTFQTETIPVGKGPSALVTGDFTGDGHTDLAVADEFSNDVMVLLGQGDGTFQTKTIPLGKAPVALVAADFTGDGHTDLAVAGADSSGIGYVTVLRGQRDGTFQTETIPTGSSFPDGLAVGDFTGDGRTDLAVADLFANEVTLLLAQPDGTFETEAVPVGTYPGTLVAGDFYGDGRTDLAVADFGNSLFTGTSGEVTVLQGQPDGTFGTETVPLGVRAFALLGGGDFYGDGRTDLAIADSFSNDIMLLRGQRDGKIQIETIPVGEHAAALAAGDFTGDGRIDLLVAGVDNLGTGSVTVLLGQGDGSFQTRGIPLGQGPVALVAADFTGDGRTDLAVADRFSNDVKVLLGQGDGTFRTETIPVGQYPVALVAGDFNGDGRTDLAVADEESNDVTVLLGKGDGTFQTETVPVGRGPYALVAGDFEGNGRTDLAVANFEGSITVLLAQPNGTFRTQTIGVGSGFGGLVAGDFTGDGRTDLAVADFGLSNDVTVLLGQPDGKFQTETVPVGQAPFGLMTGDFYGNGRTDVAVTDLASRDITLLRGHLDGTFQTQTIPLGPAQEPPGTLVTGDFTGNGRTDLAVLYGGVTVLLSQPDGAFRTLTIALGLGQPPDGLVAGDFTGNGHSDLAFSQFTYQGTGFLEAITVLAAQPDGTFRTTQTIPLGQYSTQPNVALLPVDLNGDGRTDLAVADSNSNLTLLLSKGDSTFVNPDQLNNPVRSSPLVADLNGDGVPDVVTLNNAGEILYRAGRPAALGGGFDPPTVVNPEGADPAARDVALLQTRHGTLLAALDAHDAAVTFYAPLGEGRFAQLGQLSLTGSLPVRLVAGDLTGDGLSDLVIADAGGLTVSVYLQSRDPGAGLAAPLFGPAPNYQIPVGVDPTDLALADVDGDARLDILVTDQFSGDVSVVRNGPGAPYSSLSRFRAGTGLFGIDNSSGSVAIRSDIRPLGLAPVRFDRNGPPDLIVTDRVNDRFSILRNSGAGGFLNPENAPAYATGGHPSVVVSADFNGDGLPDLAILNDQTGTISVFLGTAGGGFTPAGTYSAGNQPTGLSVYDIDGDGTPDLLVGNQYGDVLILLGNGDGTFKPYQRAGKHVALAVADLTGNGKDDLILADQSLDQVTVVYPTGQQSFDRNAGILAPGAVKVADLTGDGIPDLIVANGGGNDVLVYPGLGNGQFGPAQSFFTGTNPVSVTVADLNGDGIPDLVVADKGSNDVTVLLGQGRGPNWTLKLGPRLNSGGIGPVSTVVKDVTGPNGVPDGIPDIIVSNATSSNLAVLPGVGQGFFNDRQAIITPLPGAGDMAALPGEGVVVVNPQANSLTLVPDVRVPVFEQISSGGSNPEAVVSGDFTGDGFTDLIVANNGNGLIDFLAGDANGFSTPEALPLEVLHPTDLAVSNLDDVLYVVGENGQIGRLDLQRLALLERETAPPAAAPESQTLPPQIAVPLPLKDASITLVATLLTGFPEESLVGAAPPLPAAKGTNPSPLSGGESTDEDQESQSTKGADGGGSRARLNDFLLGIGGVPESRPLPDDAPSMDRSSSDAPRQEPLPAGRPKRKVTPLPSESNSPDAKPDREQPPEVFLPPLLEPSRADLGMLTVPRVGKTATENVDRDFGKSQQVRPLAMDSGEGSQCLSGVLVTAFFASSLFQATDKWRHRQS